MICFHRHNHLPSSKLGFILTSIALLLPVPPLTLRTHVASRFAPGFCQSLQLLLDHQHATQFKALRNRGMRGMRRHTAPQQLSGASTPIQSYMPTYQTYQSSHSGRFTGQLKASRNSLEFAVAPSTRTQCGE